MWTVVIYSHGSVLHLSLDMHGFNFNQSLNLNFTDKLKCKDILYGFHKVFKWREHKQPQGVRAHFLPEWSHYLAERDANKTDKHPSLQHACDLDAPN